MLMRWLDQSSVEIVGNTPTIKNHTATLVGTELFVFGGYARP